MSNLAKDNQSLKNAIYFDSAIGVLGTSSNKIIRDAKKKKKKINAQDVICIFLFSAIKVCYTFVIKQQKFFNRGKW